MNMFRYFLYDEKLLDVPMEKEYWKNLHRSLQEAGVVCVPVDKHGKISPDWEKNLVTGTKAQQTEIEPGQCLMLAMTGQQVTYAKEHSIPVLGLELPGQEQLSGVQMLLLGLEDLDVDFLQKQFQRCLGIPWDILSTPRCLVRELELADLPELFALYEKPHVTDYLEPLYVYDEEKIYQQEYIANVYGYFGYGMWLVRHRDTGELIGRAGVEQRIVGDETQLELGYVFAPEYWHQGYATEVCTAILEWVHRHLDFDRVEAMVEPGNEASVRLLLRLGFSDMGTATRDGKKFLHYRMILSDVGA